MSSRRIQMRTEQLLWKPLRYVGLSDHSPLRSCVLPPGPHSKSFLLSAWFSSGPLPRVTAGPATLLAHCWHGHTTALMESSLPSFSSFLQITNSGLLRSVPFLAPNLIMWAINLPHTVNGVEWKGKYHK